MDGYPLPDPQSACGERPGQSACAYRMVAFGFEHLSCLDRKSTRLNSSHLVISYAGFCFEKRNSRALGTGCSAWIRALGGCHPRATAALRMAVVGTTSRSDWSAALGWRLLSFFLMMRRPPRSTLFSSTTLFRS